MMKHKVTDGEWKAFAAGLTIGGRITTPVKSGKRTSGATSTNPISTKIGAKEAISIHCGSPLGVRGEISSVPLYISNNNVNDNGVGMAGFIAEIQFNPSLLEYQGYEIALWDGDLQVDESKIDQGRLTIIGLRSKEQGNMFDNIVLLNLKMKVSPDVSESTSLVPINFVTGTELLIIRPELFDGYMYISPVGKYSGGVNLKVDDTIPWREPIESTLQGPRNILGGGGVNSSTEVDFDLEVDLIGVDGLGSGGDVQGYLIVYWSGIVVGHYYFPLQLGRNKVKGRFPLILPPGVDYGDLDFKVGIEPDEDDETPYYIFIPAFGFNVRIITEIGDEDIINIPRSWMDVKFYQRLLLTDYFKAEILATDLKLKDIIIVSDYIAFELADSIKPPVDVNIDPVLSGVIIEGYHNIDIVARPPYQDNQIKDYVSVKDYHNIEQIEKADALIVDNNSIVGISTYYFIDIDGDPQSDNQIIDYIILTDYNNIDIVSRPQAQVNQTKDYVIITDYHNIEQVKQVDVLTVDNNSIVGVHTYHFIDIDGEQIDKEYLVENLKKVGVKDFHVIDLRDFHNKQVFSELGIGDKVNFDTKTTQSNTTTSGMGIKDYFSISIVDKEDES